MLFPVQARFLPRSIPGSGPTSKRNLAAEVNHLHKELEKLSREQAVQLLRIAQIQKQMDDIERLLKNLLRQGHR